MIYLAVFFVISTIAYNNCAGDKFEASNGLSLATTASSQCRAKIMNSAKGMNLKNPRICESAANYQCDLRHFRPQVEPGKAQSQHCVNLAGIGDTCVTVNTYSYNTRFQQQNAEAADLVEGGSYNRDEVSCINTQLTSQDIALVQTEGTTVEEALEKAIELCRQRSPL